MICITLSEFSRDCSIPVTGGISDIVTFDPEDYNFTQPAKVNGKAQKYSVIALRSGATGTGATAATSAITVAATGADGDVVNVYDPYGQLLATYTKITGDNTVTLVAVAIKNAINTGTTTHGYSANNVAGVITITAPASLGAIVNTKKVIVDDGGTVSITPVTAFSGGVTGTGGKMYKIGFQRDEAEWQWKQSRKGPSVKYDHSFIFQLPENSQNLTVFMEALDAAAACCGLGMIIRLTTGKIFVCGEKFVNGSSITRFTVLNEGSSGGSGKLYDDFNGGNITITGPYSRSLYEYGGTWADIEALM